METDALRTHLLELFGPGGAHAPFDKVVADFPAGLRGVRPAGSPHTGWRLVEHMRIAQADILAFSRDARHSSPPWPAGYWPAGDGPPAADDWDRAVAGFQADRRALIAMIADPAADLLARLPHGDGQTLAREAMLAGDHAAYHVGQLVLLRQVLGCWTG